MEDPGRAQLTGQERFGLAWCAWIAGAALPGAIQGLFELPYPGGGWRGELLLVCWSGNLLAASLAFLLVALVARILKRALPRGSTGFWCGLGLGLMPLASSVLHARFHPQPAEEWGLLIGLPVILGAGWLGRRVGTGRRTWGGILVGGALVVPLLSQVFGAPWSLPDAELRARTWEGRGALEGDGPPDLVLVSVDTLRADAVVGPDSADLPHLDRLRAAGTWAAWARSSSNATLAGHVGMLSGRGALGHGVTRNEDPVPPDFEPMSRRLQSAGWNTAAVVTNGLLVGSNGFAAGFDWYDDTAVAPFGRRLTFLRRVDQTTWLGWLSDFGMLDTLLKHPFLWGAKSVEVDKKATQAAAVVDRGLELLQAAARSEAPLFLFLHFIDPHTPYRPPKSVRGRRADLTRIPSRYRDRVVPRQKADNRLLRDLGEDLLDPGIHDEAQTTLDILHQLYLEEVEYVDAELGRLVDALDARERPYVLLITSDHGEHFGEHDTTLHANSLWEELVRVPFILHGAGVPSSEIEPPALQDVAPTLLAFAGLSIDGMDGVPLVVDRTARSPADRAHLALDHKRVAYLEGSLKWLAAWSGPGDTPETLGGFDLGVDPRESGSPTVDVGPLRRTAERLLEQARDRVSATPDDERQAFLDQMGYGEDG